MSTASATRLAIRAGSTKGPKWFSVGDLHVDRVRQPLGDRSGDRRRPGVLDDAGRHHDTGRDVGEQIPHAVQGAVLERARLVFGIALQAHALGGRSEAVCHVEADDLGIERAHRRFRPVVVDGGLERIERWTPSTGADDEWRLWRAVRSVGVGVEDDRLVDDDRVEQIGVAMGRHEQCRPTHRMAEAGEPALGSDEARRGERVVAVSRPVGVGRARVLAGRGVSPCPRRSTAYDVKRRSSASAIGR